LGGDCTESGDDGAIDGTTVEKEDADDFLDSSFVRVLSVAGSSSLVSSGGANCVWRHKVGFHPGMGRVWEDVDE
jgi:hypothetical protein